MRGNLRVSESLASGVESAGEFSSGIDEIPQPRPSVCLEDVRNVVARCGHDFCSSCLTTQLRLTGESSLSMAHLAPCQPAVALCPMCNTGTLQNRLHLCSGIVLCRDGPPNGGSLNEAGLTRNPPYYSTCIDRSNRMCTCFARFNAVCGVDSDMDDEEVLNVFWKGTAEVRGAQLPEAISSSPERRDSQQDSVRF